MSRAPRTRLATILVGISALALTACLPLPPTAPPQQTQPAPVEPAPPPTVEPVPTQTPIGTPTPPPSQDPEPSDEPDEPDSPPDGPLGEVFGGNSTSSGSGLEPDQPSTEVLQPTFGSAEIAAGSPWGDDQAGDTFLADQDPASGDNLMLSTTGRMYITYEDGSTSSCTGTVINAETDNIAITAAHCLYSTLNQSLASEIQFIPGDANAGSQAPFGVWDAELWWLPQHFIDTATATSDSSDGDGWATDYGYMRFPPSSDGHEIEEYTGGQGVSYTAETNGVITLGYPSIDPFDGNDLRFCSANQLGFGDMWWPHYTQSCDMTPGLSGGPWITDADPDTGAGYITAVSSTVTSGQASGTPLGENAYSILQETMEEG